MVGSGGAVYRERDQERRSRSGGQGQGHVVVPMRQQSGLKLAIRYRNQERSRKEI